MVSTKQAKKKHWRPRIAYGIMATIVAVVLFNLVADWLVTRYDAKANRDHKSGILAGASPRILGTKSSERAVLFVHGFIGDQSNFNVLPDAVANAGWYVETLRLPGHGTSPREFERTTADELIAGVREAVLALKEDHETVVVVGHSMGGALSTLVAGEVPVDGLVLCAPYFGLTYNHLLGVDTDWLAHRLATIVRWLPGRPNHGPVAKPEGRAHVQCYGWIPMKGVLTALTLCEQANDATLLTQITAPVLAIHSTGDSVTSYDATQAALEKMTGASTEMHLLEKSDHVIFWDYDEEEVTEAVLGFLEEVAPS